MHILLAMGKKGQLQQWWWPLYSAGMYAPADDTGTIYSGNRHCYSAHYYGGP